MTGKGIGLLKSFFASNSEQIHRLNTKNELNPSPADVKNVMKLLLEENDEFDDAIDQACAAGAALYTTAIQCIVARTYIRNPDIFAEKTAARDGSDKDFQRKRDTLSMKNYLVKCCTGTLAASETPSKESTQTKRAMMLSALFDSEEEDEDAATSRQSTQSSPNRTIRQNLFDDDEDFSQPPSMDTPKREKQKEKRQTFHEDQCAQRSTFVK